MPDSARTFGDGHAESSRPFHSDVPEGKRPYPERAKLDEMEPGWAIKIATSLVQALHSGSSQY